MGQDADTDLFHAQYPFLPELRRFSCIMPDFPTGFKSLRPSERISPLFRQDFVFFTKFRFFGRYALCRLPIFRRLPPFPIDVIGLLC